MKSETQRDAFGSGFPLLIKITLFFIIFHPAYSYTQHIIASTAFRFGGELIGKNLPHIVMLLIKTPEWNKNKNT